MNEPHVPAKSFEYDVCLSFAGEQRSYVERVAEELRNQDTTFFYDDYEKVSLWGKDLYEHLDSIYRHAARYAVLFASAEYAQKVWTNHERRSMQARAMSEAGEYILPARFDDTEIPGLRPTVGYIDLRRMEPGDFATLIVEKLKSTYRSEPASASLSIGVPKTPEEQRGHINRQPKHWEYLLYAGVLIQGKSSLEEKWLDTQIGYARRNGVLIERADAIAYFRNALSDIGAASAMVMRVLDPHAQEQAFGLPGTPGDSGRIIHLGNRLIGIYDEYLDWAIRLRSARIPHEFERAFELAARLADRPAGDIRKFVDSFVLEAEKIPAIVARPGNEQIVIQLTLTLTADDEAISQCLEEFKRAIQQSK